MKNKNGIWIPLVVLGLILLLPNGCKKEHVAIVPSLTTAAVSAITQTTASSGGEVTSDGGSTITARGVCWSTGATPTTSDSKTSDGTGPGSFTSAIIGLTANTAYNVRAYATNSAGTAYGSVVAFTTSPLPLAVLTTTAITDITLTTAIGGGNVTSDSGLPVTARGICWSTGATPTTADSKSTNGTGTGSFVSNLTSLTGNTTYHVRAYATTDAGTAYGDAVSFTTLALPEVTTTDISDIAVIASSGGGNVTAEGSSAVTARGVCWGLTTAPTTADDKTTDGTGTGIFISSLTGLTANTKYFIRAYATNAIGTAYGNEVTFTTYGVVDIDGNGYPSVIIGTQEWMKENLTVTTYRDGTAIPNVTDATDWSNLSTGAYAVYNNTPTNAAIYGRLYNWFAVTDSRELCPTGWHSPESSEWDVLATTLGGASVAGGKMKATETLLNGGFWNSPNTDATNESGFSALPGGVRGDNGSYADINSYAHLWSATAGAPSFGTYRRLRDSHGMMETFDNSSTNGKSVRCVKD